MVCPPRADGQRPSTQRPHCSTQQQRPSRRVLLELVELVEELIELMVLHLPTRHRKGRHEGLRLLSILRTKIGELCHLKGFEPGALEVPARRTKG